MRRSAGAALLVLLAAPGPYAGDARAQAVEPPPPPRILHEPAPPPAAAQAPNRARLAAAPADADAVDEIVVTGGDGWRAPDLGSAWRAEEQARIEARRYRRQYFPLYDATLSLGRTNLFIVNRESMRVGYLQIFRIRVGRERD